MGPMFHMMGFISVLFQSPMCTAATKLGVDIEVARNRSGVGRTQWLRSTWPFQAVSGQTVGPRSHVLRSMVKPTDGFAVFRAYI